MATPRRQASTTSLSKFARSSSPSSQNQSLNFCNAFWGVSDAGVDVLFARMRGATRTIDELKTYWKERASIEDDYAKRMAKLAKVPLGRDEIGDLRAALDTLRAETDKQASYHQTLASQVRTDLESQTSAFSSRQTNFKKHHQSHIEKAYKVKQTHESHVRKAREKYEQDCLRINSYTAQSTLVQGKDLEKIHIKLERAQMTVQANERDFANFAKALSETVKKWEGEWKNFCDLCQDLEEDRLEFMKDNMWAYANAVSTVCVSDDESCEKMRVSLEQVEPEKDMENFVRDYGTGNLIPDPPAFVNYTTADAIPSSESRPTTHPALFPRSTQRVAGARPDDEDIPQQPVYEEPTTNAAGIGAGTNAVAATAPLTRQPTTASNRVPVPTTNGVISPGSQAPVGNPTGNQGFKPTQDPNADPINPMADTMLRIGPNAYPVDLSRDPQQQQPSQPSRANTNTSGGSSAVDPLAKQMEELQSAAGSIRKTNTPAGNSRRGTLETPGTSASLSLPAAGGSGSQPQQSRDYRNSAEFVVGSHPAATSRPTSPNPPTAAFMTQQKTGGEGTNVEQVVTDYYQSLPGERKSVSRPGSRQGSFSGTPNNVQGQNLARPTSAVGHTGIGAHGSRSNSPQPSQHRAVSPNPNRNSFIAAPPGSNVVRSGSIDQRAMSPNNVGIALDPSGRVAHDDMANRYAQQQQQRQASYSNGPQRQASYGGPPAPIVAPPPQTAYAPPPAQAPYASASPVGYHHVQQPSAYAPSPYAPPPQQQHYQQPPPQQVYQPQPHQGAYTNGVNGRGYDGYNAQQMQVPQQTGYQQPQTTGGYINRAPSPAAVRAPSPMGPGGPTTEDGTGILFYVKALYDYTATIPEEFDFQTGDIIAVTATPEDGWWSGELLDEDRRQKGRHVFPSNFVCLF